MGLLHRAKRVSSDSLPDYFLVESGFAAEGLAASGLGALPVAAGLESALGCLPGEDLPLPESGAT